MTADLRTILGDHTTGRLVEAEFVRADRPPYDCGLEGCECPDHETGDNL